MRHILAGAALAAAAVLLMGQTRVPPSGVTLVSEKAPSGRACGNWMELTYRACKPVPRCDARRIDPRHVNDLFEQIQVEIDQKVGGTCQRLRCRNDEIRNDSNRFACTGSAALCMTRTLEYRCRPSRADTRERTSPEPKVEAREVVPEVLRPARSKQVAPVIATPPPEPPPPTGPGRLADHGGGGGDGILVPDLDIVSNELVCVDPKVEVPPVLTAPTGTPDDPDQGVHLEPSLVSGSGGSSRLVFTSGGPSAGRGVSRQTGETPARAVRSARDLAARGRPAATGSGEAWCRAQALDRFQQSLSGPLGFPDPRFPDQPCDNGERCVEAAEGWVRAHYYVWAARQVIHYNASRPHSAQRSYLWGRPGVIADPDPNNDPTASQMRERTVPAFWFGAYSEKRFATVKRAIDKLWDVMNTASTGSIGIHLRCPTASGNVCQTKKPGAHHIVKGYVDLCGSYFQRGAAARGQLVAHELLHHLFVKYGDIWVAIQDHHYHGHGLGCGIDPGSEAHYGEGKILHLAGYRNSNGNDCGHLARNVRNNDTYAWFAAWIGDLVYHGALTEWPEPTQPTPQPPQCEGEEGCLCEDQDSWPLNEYFEPDGDFSPDLWCDDNDGEMTCQATKFGASTKGICTKCDDRRGGGCECDLQRPCEVGSCYGDDTFGGGVGRCYPDPPPTWACLADCKRLFNSSGAWCYADYPTGRARCMDHLCSKPEAYACAQQGKVCRYGECVVECETHADCADKGYPPTFACQQSRCEFID